MRSLPDRALVPSNFVRADRLSGRLVAVLTAAILGACASTLPAGPAPEPAPPRPVDTPALWPAPFRLSTDVRPERYRLHLRINPTQQEFSGSAEIEVALGAPTRLLRLHADGLVITEAAATTISNEPAGTAVPASPVSTVRPVPTTPIIPISLTASTDGQGNLVLVAPQPLSGHLRLRLAYHAPLAETPDGLYRVEDGTGPAAAWYAFTQFEPLAARRAFPCFDEPGFKAPWMLSIDAPDGMLAVANTPETGRAPASEAGWTTFHFATTQPLPSYLVAFAVGPFDVVDGPAVSGGRVPLRVVTTRGKGSLAAYTLARVPAILDWLEAWFGIPYAFPKLDLLAVPNFAAGAMENPGLVTFREVLILMDGAHARPEERRSNDGVVAHELAHMWFGDLVTPAWWDDTWLNEAFASWIAGRAMAELRPEYQIDVRAVVGMAHVMDEDARPGARAVRQPIAEAGDIGNAFDGITYQKGSAILGMLSDWLGPMRFRDALRSFLTTRAFRNATRADLVADLAKVGAMPEVASVVDSFTGQAGVPVVSLAWTCGAPPPNGPGGVPVTLVLGQQPYRALGDRRSATERWTIPVCLTAGWGAPRRTTRKKPDAALDELRTCEVLAEASATRTWVMPSCPDWIRANGEERGYYRVEVAPPQPPAARQAPEHALGWLATLRAAVLAGVAPAFEAYLDAALEPLARPLGELEFDEASQALAFVRALTQGDPAARAKLTTLVVHVAKTQLAGRAQPWELAGLARLALLQAGDKRAVAEARRVTEAWLADPGHGGGASASLWVPLAARALGDAPSGMKAREVLWTRLRAALDTAPTPVARGTAITALGSFDAPELVTRTWDLLIDGSTHGTLRAQDMRNLGWGLGGASEAVLAAHWAWLQQHFEALVARLGPAGSARLPSFAAGLCREAQADEVTTFFEAHRANWPPGLAHHLQLATESIRACAGLRAAYGAAAKAWLAKPHAGPGAP